MAAGVVHSFTHIACPSSALARRVLFVTVTDAEDGWRDPECAEGSVVPSNVRRVASLEERQLWARSTSERIA